MIRKTYVSLLLLVAGGIALSAQGGYGISGTVVDEYGPVIGAAVVEQGTVAHGAGAYEERSGVLYIGSRNKVSGLGGYGVPHCFEGFLYVWDFFVDYNFHVL